MAGPKFLSLAPNADIDAELLRRPTPRLLGKLELTRDGETRAYGYRALQAAPGERAIIEVTSDEFEVYSVRSMTDGRYDCECMDFQCRSGPQVRPCKHIFAAMLLGLLGGTSGIDNNKPAAVTAAAELDDL